MVDWEIRESIALGKGVIAMYKGDSPPTRYLQLLLNSIETRSLES